MDLGTENQSKINAKCDRKQDASWDRVWMALGSIFDPFWPNLEGKLGPSWHQNQKKGGQDDVNKS